MTKVTVIGAGTWGMALALLLDKKGAAGNGLVGAFGGPEGTAGNQAS